MPTPTQELNRLDSNTFEHMVNMLALEVLGKGNTGFGPGSDGGRDGYFEGRAPYPSTTDNWSGRWYIQSKFKQSAAQGDPQKWLLKQIKDELAEFTKPRSKRDWPDNWIVATNIDPSGIPTSGAFDRARKLVADKNPSLAKRFHIWGGRKILDLLALHPSISAYYSEFVTPGQVLAKLYEQLGDAQANIEEIVRYLIVSKLVEEQYTKLEQAGSTADNRPGIQRLFTDLPFTCPPVRPGMAAIELALTAAQNHRIRNWLPEDTDKWHRWHNEPGRARVWFVKGGPGQGKSTLTQYIAQIQRAAIALTSKGLTMSHGQKAIAQEVKKFSEASGLWPIAPRIPVSTELKEYAQWFGRRKHGQSKRFLAFLTETLSASLPQTVHIGTLTRAFKQARWLFIFDGLDEVPGDAKDAIASEIGYFVDDTLIGCHSDSLIVCTSRPQGYAGQFDSLGGATIILAPLSKEQALACAKPVLEIDRSAVEARRYFETLNDAIESPTVAEIMTTPLQSHIMAIVVRDGGRPPDRKWDLFSNFYKTIKRREANRNLPDKRIAALLREEDKLLKSLHNRLGFVLHARAETSNNAVTALNRTELPDLFHEVVSELRESNVNETINLLVEATTERLVLVNTPDASSEVRFDIRPLQEFFAAEYIYEAGQLSKLDIRLRAICMDSHWREVMHFLFSGLVENERPELAASIDILVECNNGADDPTRRPLQRRLAIGSLIAARLLQEGVLEQDKRVRSQFRACMGPILACTDGVSQLRNVTSPHSQLWLSDVLIDTMLEQYEGESIGASLVAPMIVSDSHPRLATLENFLLGASREYLNCFLQHDSWIELEMEDELCAPKWLIKVALSLLFCARWFELDRHSLLNLMMIVRQGKAEIPRAAIELGYGRLLAEALPEILGLSPERSVKDVERRDRIADAIEITYRTTPENRKWEKWDEEIWTTLRGSDGLLKALYLAVRFIESKTEESGNKVLEYFGDKRAHIGFLPNYVLAYYSDGLVNRWGRGKECNWEEMLQNDMPGCHRYLSVLRTAPNPKPKWDELLRDWPTFAWHTLFGRTGGDDLIDQFGEYVTTEGGRECLRQSVKKSPDAWVSAILTWENYLSAWDRENQLRSSLLDCAKILPAAEHRYLGRIELDPLKPKLPSEAAFLPHIAAALADSIHSQVKEETGKELSITQRFGERVHKIIPSPNPLRQIMDQPGDVAIKAAATVLWMAHPDRDLSNPMPLPGQLASLYAPSIGPWYLKALGIVLSDLIYREDPASVAAIGMLIESTREDYQTRVAFDSVLRLWREIARAPIHSRQQSDLWNSPTKTTKRRISQ